MGRLGNNPCKYDIDYPCYFGCSNTKCEYYTNDEEEEYLQELEDKSKKLYESFRKFCDEKLSCCDCEYSDLGDEIGCICRFAVKWFDDNKGSK